MKRIKFLPVAIMAFSMLISSCEEEEEATPETVAPAVAVIGDFRDGGIVFWVDSTDNTHGLVCAVTEQSTSIRWDKPGFANVFVTGTNEDLGTGAANTDLIIASKGADTTYAAGLARAFEGGGFNDWFLPSTDELVEMYSNKATINATATANSGNDLLEGASEGYWSSTQVPGGGTVTYPTGSMYLFSFTSGTSNGVLGVNSRNVRAVRRF